MEDLKSYLKRSTDQILFSDYFRKHQRIKINTQSFIILHVVAIEKADMSPNETVNSPK